MRFPKFLIFFSVLFFTINSSELQAQTKQIYTIEDLQVLEAEKSSLEFLKHAKDIPPSKRDRRWQQLVINMAGHYLNEAMRKNEFSRAKMEFISDFVSWNTIQNDETTLKYARDYYTDYLDLCFSRASTVEGNPKINCYLETLWIWNRLPPNPQFGLELARMIKSQFKEKSIWPFIKYATKSNFSEYYCSLPIVQDEVVHIFLKDFHDLKDETSIAIKVQDYISTNCLTLILPTLREIAFSSSLSRDTAFWILKSFNAVDLFEEDFYLVQSLLIDPKQGELLNLAWSRVKDLGQDPVRRQKVMNRLMSLDPIPDKVFSHQSNEISEVIARHIEKNFPEFFPAYFKTCFLFYSGKKKYPRGNPTPACRQAGKLTIGSYGHSQKVHRILSGIKKR